VVREIAIRGFAGLLAFFSLFGFNSHALAASQTWSSTGVTANWSSSANWGGNPAPGSTTSSTSTDVATFNTAVGAVGTAGNPVIIDQPAQNIDGISFDTNAGNFVIGTTSGNPLLLTSGGTIQILSTLLSTNAIETINAPLIIEGTAYTITNNAFNGTGATDGTLLIGGAITSSTVAAVLTLSGSNTNANTVSGVISNSGTNSMGVTKTGVGLWILSGSNTYTGTTTVTTGTLDAGVASVPGVSGAFGLNGPVTLANTAGVALNLNGFNTQIGSLAGGGTTGGTVLLGGNTLTIGGTTTATFAGTVSGTGNFVEAGPGRQTLSGSNNYTGNTTVSSGTLEFAAENSLYSDGTSSWNGSKIFVQAGATLGLIVSGSSPQFTTTDLAAFLASMDATSSSTAGFETGSIFGIDTANATNGVFTYANTISNAYAGGTLGLSKLGANTLVLAGTNTYSGPTSVTAGALEFANESSLYNDSTASWTGSNIIVLSGATLELSVGAAPNFTASDLGTLLTNMATTSSTNSGFETGSILGLDTTNATGGLFAYSGVIANGYAGGTLGLNKFGPGTLTLSGPSTYTGSTTITSGTLQAGVASVANVSGAFGLNSSVTLANSPGVTLNITGFNTQIGSLAGSGTSGANVILAGNTLTINGTSTASTTFAGPISGAGGSLVKSGSSTQILSGTDAFTGSITVNGGALEFANEPALYNDAPASWTGSNIIVQSGTFILGAGAAQFNTTDVGTFLSHMDATSSGTSGFESGATLGFDTGAAAGGAFVLANNLTNTYAGSTLNLTKTGANTLILTGSNSYSGTTTIGGGTLEFLNENSLYGDN
jgi:autotransporter-associated beta strand protein